MFRPVFAYSGCWQNEASACGRGGCILRRVGECGVSVGVEQRGFVGLWQPHLRAQNIAANEWLSPTYPFLNGYFQKIRAKTAPINRAKIDH